MSTKHIKKHSKSCHKKCSRILNAKKGYKSTEYAKEYDIYLRTCYMLIKY